jgi:predicted nucleic acid-binding protein
VLVKRIRMGGNLDPFATASDHRQHRGPGSYDEYVFLSAFRRRKQVRKFMKLEAPADTLFSELRARLERAGQTIGANDLLMAAHALTLGHTVVTDNEREFSRFKDLRIENWLR